MTRQRTKYPSRVQISAEIATKHPPSVVETGLLIPGQSLEDTVAALVFGLPGVGAGVLLWVYVDQALGVVVGIMLSICLAVWRGWQIHESRRLTVVAEFFEPPEEAPAPSMLQPSSGQASYSLYTDLAKAFLNYMCKEPGKPLVVRNWKPAGRNGFTQETFAAVLGFLDSHAMLDSSGKALTIAAKREMGKWAADKSDDAPDGKLPDSLVEDFRKLESARPTP